MRYPSKEELTKIVSLSQSSLAIKLKGFSLSIINCVLSAACTSYVLFLACQAATTTDTQQADDLIMQGKFLEARDCCNKGIAQHPDDPLWYQLRGRSYYMQGDCEESKLGNRRTVFSRDNYEKAVHDFSKAIELDKKNCEAYSSRGAANRWLKRSDAAIADFNAAIDIKPDAPEYYRYRGEVHADMKQFDQALTDYAKVLALLDKKHGSTAKSDAGTQLEYGTIYLNLGALHQAQQQNQKAVDDYSQAISHFRAIKSSIPILSSCYACRADALLSQKNYKAAIDDCLIAMSQKFPAPQAFIVCGQAYSRLGQPRKALDTYNTAIKTYETFAQAYSERAKVYRTLGNKALSEKDRHMAQTLGYAEPH